MLGLEVAGVGFSLVSVGDFLDVLADWGEGEIDGQGLVQRGAAELALAVTSLIGVGAVVKGGKKLLEHLPPSWTAKAEEFLGRLFSRDRTERDEPGTPDEPESPRTPDAPGNALPLDPDRPWTFDIAQNDLRFLDAHTTAKHGAGVPLRREDAGPGERSIEGRIYGDRPWDRRENTSSRWLSEEVMKSTVEEHVRQHWGEIVERLATGQSCKTTFDAGHPVGEGFINANRGTSGPRQAVYGQTDDVTLIIDIDPTTGEPYVVTAYPNLTHLYPR